MTYIHIPVDFQNPTNQDFEQFCAVMERLGGICRPLDVRRQCPVDPPARVTPP
jgi:hypothetical protein